jgi:hypothetical protein
MLGSESRMGTKVDQDLGALGDGRASVQPQPDGSKCFFHYFERSLAGGRCLDISRRQPTKIPPKDKLGGATSSRVRFRKLFECCEISGLKSNT